MPPQAPDRVAFLAPSLGTRDGRAENSARWQQGFLALGTSVKTAAFAGVADHALDVVALERGDHGDLERTLSGADIVVIEDLCSSDYSAGAAFAVARLLRGRRVLLRHHVLPWQPGGRRGPVLDDPAWRHVTVNERSRLELRAQGIAALARYPRFDPAPRPGSREATRSLLGYGPGDRLILQPTRGALQKNVAGGLRLAGAVAASYWLLGDVAEEFRPLFDELMTKSPCPFYQGRPESLTLADAYAASDVVALPSSWEAFGNAAIEAATYRRPFVVGTYPVAAELRRFGFSWFELSDPAPLARYLESPDPFVLDRNELVARRRFSSDELPAHLLELLEAVNLPPWS